MRARAFILGAWLAACGFAVFGKGTGVHLTCRLSAIAEEADEGRYACIGDSGTIRLDVSTWDYMTDYLRADNGREVVITIEAK